MKNEHKTAQKMKRMFVGIGVLFGCQILTPYAEAQEDSAPPAFKTPRQQILVELGLAGETRSSENVSVDENPIVMPKVEVPVGTKAISIVEPQTKQALKPIAKIPEPQEPPQAPIPDIFKAKPLAKPSEPVVINSITKTPPSKAIHVQPNQGIAPFYLSAAQYLKRRGVDPQPQTTLFYSVKNQPLTGGAGLANLSTQKDVQIILGADYAGLQVGKKRTIYDFKFNRVLTIQPDYKTDGTLSGVTYFQNASLYAAAFKTMTNVRAATQNGRRRKLDLGKGVVLDAFWIESAMSLTVQPANEDLQIDKTDNSLSVSRDGEVVFSAKFTEDKYQKPIRSTKGQRGIGQNSLLVFAHHEWPLHPQILDALYSFDAPPETMEMISYGPTAPKGQKQVWQLVKRVDNDVPFPLEKDAKNLAKGTPQSAQSPLAFLIDEAVNNRAQGGMKTVAELADDFTAKVESEDYAQAWIISQQLKAYAGGCHSSEISAICAQSEDVAEAHKESFPKSMQAYVEAVALAGQRNAAARVKTVKLLEPYLTQKSTPGFIHRTVAMARARLKQAQAKAGGVETIDAQENLISALAKDPYDPNTYVGLAQVLAADGAIEQSWDVNDALRAGIPTAKSLKLKIDNLEGKLEKSMPGFFLGE